MTPKDRLMVELSDLRSGHQDWCFSGIQAGGMFQIQAIHSDSEFDPRPANARWPIVSSWCGSPSRAAAEVLAKLGEVQA